MATLEQLLMAHDNEYGFDPLQVCEQEPVSTPSLSIVIPYYNTGAVFAETLKHFKYAADNYSNTNEIIVVDDGSKEAPVNEDLASSLVKIIKHHKNLGRTEARNTGLSQASGEIVVFADSDILPDNQQLKQHATLQAKAASMGLAPIVISFFDFIEKAQLGEVPDYIQPNHVNINDFRIDCNYGSTWIGCDDDIQFIGQHIRIMDATNNLRDWNWKYKPWALPNMVLGGLFSVVRSEINAVGAFDSRFTGYGFTETSAVAKMIATRNNVVIPALVGGAFHIADPETNLTQAEKDILFRQKHDYFFETFLKEEADAYDS